MEYTIFCLGKCSKLSWSVAMNFRNIQSRNVWIIIICSFYILCFLSILCILCENIFHWLCWWKWYHWWYYYSLSLIPLCTVWFLRHLQGSTIFVCLQPLGVLYHYFRENLKPVSFQEFIMIWIHGQRLRFCGNTYNLSSDLSYIMINQRAKNFLTSFLEVLYFHKFCARMVCKWMRKSSF